VNPTQCIRRKKIVRIQVVDVFSAGFLSPSVSGRASLAVLFPHVSEPHIIEILDTGLRIVGATIVHDDTFEVGERLTLETSETPVNQFRPIMRRDYDAEVWFLPHSKAARCN
jgi:hypothetical protein